MQATFEVGRVTLHLDPSDAKAAGRNWKMVHVDQRKALVSVADVMHVSRDGTVQALRPLAKRLSEGWAGCPARPFMKDYVEQHHDFIIQTMRSCITYTRKASNIDQSKHRLHGIWVFFASTRCAKTIAADLTKWLLTNSYYKAVAPNAPMTIRLKGSDQPLVDTTALAKSIIGRSVSGR